MIDQELLLCFLDEALDSLKQWERACLDLEASPTQDTYSTLFRSAHNLKGSSRAVGLDAFGAFVHVVEDLINLVMKGTLPLTSEIVGALLECQVFLERWIDGLRGDSGFVPDTAELKAKVIALQTPKSASAPAPIQQVALSAEAKAEAELEALFEKAREDYVTTRTQKNGGTSDAGAAAPQNSGALGAKPAETTPKIPEHKGQKADDTIRISAARLDELIQLVGELSIHQAIVYQAKRDNNLGTRICQNAIHLSNKITKDLHTKALSLRMQPLQGLFQRLERVARDVARAQGKKVVVEVEGAEVELDKTVIERITDPLIHILRNAIDHGLEATVDERKAASKPEVSRVLLRATQDATGVCIRVSDDGRGLNAERIRKKAIERDIIREDQELSLEEVHKLIFLPGFSTAEKVTDISGRGVGMDVVMKAVQALQGSISIDSKLGSGTTFAITLPTSLSIVDALVVTLDSMRYAIPMHELTEIIDLTAYTIESTGNKGRMLSLRGDVVPLASLKRFMRMHADQCVAMDREANKPALVVRNGPELIAFEIDAIIGQQQVVVRPMSDQLATLQGFNGCTILGDGEPGMILSLGDIARSYFDSNQVRH